MGCPFRKLIITDGTVSDSGVPNTVDLLDGTSGFCLTEWRPAISGLKGGGVWADSSLADGRRLQFRKAENVRETYVLEAHATDADTLIRQTQKLRRLLDKARDYWTSNWQDTPVWIEAVGTGETNTRYALIMDWATPMDADPYHPPFSGPSWAGMSEWELIIEREPYWTSQEPETGTTIELSAMEAYDGRNLGNVDSTGARDPTSAEEVYVCPKRSEANLTDVYTWSAANGWSGNLMVAGLPYALVDIAGAAPAINDFVIFGVDTTLADSGPFTSIVFDIGTAISGISLTWEYWNGAWVALSAQDNTNGDGAGGGSPLDTTGVCSIHWATPSDWVTKADGPAGAITGYWVRARVVAVPGPHVAPTQQNRDLYAITWAYTQIEDDQVLGDIPATTRILVRNQSDAGGLTLWANRVIVGLRSMDRGAAFEAYINFADEQNPGTITVGVAGAAAFANNVQTPTGRYVNLPAGALDGVTIGFAAADADLYRGRFHMYIRGEQQGAGTLQVNVSIGAGTARTYTTTSTSTADWQLFDFGVVIIPNSPIDASESMLGFTINVTISQLSGTPTVHLYDLILIPVDEFAADLIAVDPSDSNSVLGYRNAPDGTYLSIDSIYRPKSPLRAMLVSDDLTTPPEKPIQAYQSIAVPPAILQTNEQQRLWFLLVKEDTGVWYANQEIGSTILVDKNQRYFSMRGDR